MKQRPPKVCSSLEVLFIQNMLHITKQKLSSVQMIFHFQNKILDISWTLQVITLNRAKKVSGLESVNCFLVLLSRYNCTTVVSCEITCSCEDTGLIIRLILIRVSLFDLYFELGLWCFVYKCIQFSKLLFICQFSSECWLSSLGRF